MKILELRFKNLNSLYGEWRIDFRDEDYQLHGIFALTGPTGAGKSTILDAICLALYGATPRLGRITATANDLMSRQTGVCFAEVVFASQAGVFRCRWEQRRARQSPTGNLQPQQHEIADAQTGQLLESRVSQVVGVVEEKTGMDFERFTRSVLLAQGSFDAFLKADAEDKSKLLEQITGTAIYSAISLKVHERRRAETDKLNALKASMAAIHVLNDDEVVQLQQQLQHHQQAQQRTTEQLNQLAAALQWHENLQQLQRQQQQIQREQQLLAQKKQQFGSEQKRLERADQAALLEGEYAAYTMQQQQLQQLDTQLSRWRAPQTQSLAALQEQIVVQQTALEQCLAGRDIVDYEREKEALWREKVLLAKVAQLEQERDALHAGQPCPLCGSTTHPYAQPDQLPRVDEVDQQITAIETRLKQVQQSTAQLERLQQLLPIYSQKETIVAAQHQWQQAVEQSVFLDERDFIAARLTPEQRQQLSAQSQKIVQQEMVLAQRLAQCQRDEAAEQHRAVSTQSAAELSALHRGQSAIQQQHTQRIAQLQYQLNQQQQAMQQVQAQQQALAAQQKEGEKWEQLHALIGSADGKKYRNFAQGLTFDIMVQHANQQLEKMTDRYVLVQEPSQPLALFVRDHYQAGEQRSTKNLSGGESFIVSLSLALGLSKMASQTVRVDSLFLDEGFGTLDEQALDTALGTLAALQQEDKLIGIISHVPALKERIATQIQVSTGQGGRSRIDGPGCSQIE